METKGGCPRGGCLCNAVRYELSSDPIVHIACHCRTCQYVGGGAPTLAALYPKSAVSITQGAVKTYWSKSDSGVNVGRSFCAAFGTPLFAGPEENPQFVAIKVGSLDDPSAFKVQLDIWRSTAQPWHTHYDDAKQFDKNPSR